MIITTIYGFLIAWFFTEFPLFKEIVAKIKTNKFDCNTGLLISKFKQALMCHKCMSFWITLIFFLDPISAIAASFLAATYNRIINSLPINL